MLRLRKFPAGCTTRPEYFFSPITESVRQLLYDTFGVLDPNPGQPRQTCPYNQWVPAEAVLYADTRAKKETLRRLFQDRAVMIGADIRGAPDLVQSPVHGQIPGVFLHAMALDNLLELGLEAYWRPMLPLPKMPASLEDLERIPPMTLIECGLVHATFLISSLVGRWRKQTSARWRPAVFPLVELVGHMTLVLGAVAALAAFAIAPFNWLGLAGLALSKDVLQQFIPAQKKAGRNAEVRS